MYCVPIHVCSYLQAHSLRARKFTLSADFVGRIGPILPNNPRYVCCCASFAQEDTEAQGDEIICFKPAELVLVTALS